MITLLLKNVLSRFRSDAKYIIKTISGAANNLTIEDIAEDIKENRINQIVVMTGAGLSTASGVPDFRSPGTGLYHNLSSFDIEYPEAIFEIGYFLHNPKPFYTVANQLCSTGQYKPNYAHYFIKLLCERDLLLRLYTQNIDGLERLAGIPVDKLVEAHGSFDSGTCVLCSHRYDGSVVKGAITASNIPLCTQPGCKGVIKPDVVFFGENLPLRFFMHDEDMKICDLLIIIGTSLEVYPFAGIVEQVGFNVPRILFNRNHVGPFGSPLKRPNDIAIARDLIEGLKVFVEKLGWKDDLSKVISKESGV